MTTLKTLMDMRGRVALVTGGAGHIGTCIGETLAELGASVVVLDQPGKCEEAVRQLADGHSAEAFACPADVADSAALGTVPGRIQERFGRLDVLVNCAALVGTSELRGWATAFEAQGLEAWRRALDVNLTAPFVLTQACAPLLRASGHGSIINVASIYGLVGPDWRLYEDTPLGNPAAYGATKGGLLQLTRWLATTLAPEIRVNALTPGGVLRDTPEPFLSRYTARTPLRRMAVEEDLKGAAAYLASDLSAYVTGHNLVVDGGWTAW